MPNEQRFLKVFLCHASQDKPAVREVAKRLFAEGWIDPWLDEKKLLPGQDWRLKIEEAVETSDIVIICLSSNSVSKEGFVQKELRYAREIALEKPDETIFLIPLRLDNCETPRGLRFYQWVDYFDEKKDESYGALIESLKLRYEQKLRLEEAEHARQEKYRVEREAADNAKRGKTEREVTEKATLEKAKRALNVFLCHGSQDKPKVRDLYRYLRKRGIRPWFDEVDLIAGQDWQVEIPKALATSDAIIICLTKNSVDREGYIQKEIRFALDKALEMPEGRNFLIPVRFEECKVPFAISRYQWVDLFEETGYSRMIKALKFRASQLERSIVKIPATRDVIEKDTEVFEENEQKAIEIAVRAQINHESVERKKQERAKRLKEILSKAKPFLRIGGIVGIALVLFWIGSLASLQFPSMMPTATASITADPTSTIALSSSPVVSTRTEQPTATPTTLIPPTPSALPFELTDAKGVEMILVDAGEFIMGRDSGAEDEKPAHQVYLDNYYIDKFEVTNARYKACVNKGICQPPKQNYVQGPTVSQDFTEGTNASTFTITDYYGNIEYQDFPVVYVDWSMAKAYCEWRGARLPTEAEWEKAARGTDGQAFPWGNEFECHAGNFFDFGGSWYDIYQPEHPKAGDWVVGPKCDSYIGPSPIGTFSSGSSPFDVYEISGNVWEWVSSLYKGYPYNPSENESSGENALRVFRGGSFYSAGSTSQSSVRKAAQENHSATDLGFRCAMSP